MNESTDCVCNSAFVHMMMCLSVEQCAGNWHPGGQHLNMCRASLSILAAF